MYTLSTTVLDVLVNVNKFEQIFAEINQMWMSIHMRKFKRAIIWLSLYVRNFFINLFTNHFFMKKKKREREGEKEGNVFISIITYPSVDARLVYFQDTLFLSLPYCPISSAWISHYCDNYIEAVLNINDEISIQDFSEFAYCATLRNCEMRTRCIY